jgi:AcrR family transcriptional regulator
MAVEGTAVPARRRDRRHERHDATRQEILDAAWRLMRAEGVAALSLRALARAVGMEPQSLYSYFDSKHAIYDALFGEANQQLLGHLGGDPVPDDPVDALRGRAHRFVDFCVEDPARYQLLFQRNIPGFEPSEESYALARRVLDGTRRNLAGVGLHDEAHLDMWTSVIAGVVAQQTSNEPGGQRFVRHLDRLIDMYLSHLHPERRDR